MPSVLGAAIVSGETLGAMLKRLREAAGLSQNQLARQAGCDPAYINRMERGGQQTRSGHIIPIDRPRTTVILAIAEVLGIGPGLTDRLLFAAGLATQTDWQSRAIRAETALATIQQAFDDHVQVDEEPTFIRRQVG